ncbi:MAG: hypothetical protein ACKVT0_17510 [Planctomycetaceae bacterium]
MTSTRRRFALSLICLTGVCWMAGLTTAAAGIWDSHVRSRPSASHQRVPTPAELGVFFVDAAAPTPESLESLGNEVAIDDSDVDPVSVNEHGSAEPADVEPQADSADVDECQHSNCDVHGHSWWCRTSKFWRHKSSVKSSHKLNHQTYYKNVPAYRVENYGFYRTCWHRLQECDCCPEDEIHEPNMLIPEPETIKE